jgi:hypothetical protein
MHYCRALSAGLLMAVSAPAIAIDDEPTGWTPQTFKEPEPWQEQDSALPAYPREDNLIEVPVSSGGRPYTIHVDPASVTMTDDRVARYTVVIISSSGVWNVAHEGLHCGEREYRRYAYGVGGRWHSLEASGWLPVSGTGMNRYRRVFYDKYMCNPDEPYLKAREIVEMFRYPIQDIDD